MAQNDDWYLDGQPKPSLRKWIFQNMAMGAVYAALAFFGVIAIILVIRAISHLLPEDPFAALETGGMMIRALV